MGLADGKSIFPEIHKKKRIAKKWIKKYGYIHYTFEMNLNPNEVKIMKF